MNLFETDIVFVIGWENLQIWRCMKHVILYVCFCFALAQWTSLGCPTCVDSGVCKFGNFGGPTTLQLPC